MLHECQETASVSKRRRDSTIVRPIDFDPWSEPMHTLPMNSLL